MEKQPAGVIEKIVLWSEFQTDEMQTIASLFVAHHKLPKKAVPDLIRIFDIAQPSFILGVDAAGKSYSRLANRDEAKVVAVLIREYIL